ncbi:MAG: glycosyltransferase family 4 protein [Actinomycetota bacterium]|jgi:L-malate glycosyltransferase|nr:glycosyltransferase family 4 protein [Actinomycetota bacterium]
MTQAVHQLVPTITPRDAVGNHTFRLREVLRGLGYDSEIFAMFRHGDVIDDTHLVDQLPPDADGLIYQFSIGSPLAERWANYGGRRIMNYHNITPIELVGKWDGLLNAEVRLGREQMELYAETCEHAICDSDFNRSELDALGYASTETVPVLFDVADAKPDKAVISAMKRKRRGLQILFVGRIAPNKAHHDLVAIVRTLRDVYGNDAHLHVVGTDGPPTYRKVVDDIVAHADMAEHITFHGSVSQEALVAFYQAADVFCCVSDHEGFCVPVIEAMHHGLPVVAYDCTAVGGTVGYGGLLLANKHPLTVATALHRVADDSALHRRMSEAGRRRAADFAVDRTRAHFADSLQRVLATTRSAS